MNSFPAPHLRGTLLEDLLGREARHAAAAQLLLSAAGSSLHLAAGGSEGMLRQLIAGFSESPAAALGAAASLPLAPPVRTMAAGALAAAVKVSPSTQI